MEDSKVNEELEAKKKYEKFKSLDPYPDIKPALLNSADIESYVNATGMVDPFYPKLLKSASYEVRISGVYKYWDGNGKPQSDILSKEAQTFTLEPNSIAFVEVEPKFRLPDYIALRFNLKIKHVYRGLLLGTGPLIDPGYVGKIYIPLHNLTSNHYTFEYGEGLIWVEFTKISEAARWCKPLETEIEKIGKYREFDPKKSNKSLDYFLNRAKKGGTIRSSIPNAIKKSEKMTRDAAASARTAKEEVEAAKEEVQKTKNIGMIAGIGVVVSIASLIFTTLNMQKDYVAQISELTSELKIQLNEQKIEQEKLTDALNEANNKIRSLTEIVAKTMESPKDTEKRTK